MKNLSISFILIVCALFSTASVAEQVVAVISSINYENRVIVVGNRNYYLPKKVRPHTKSKVVIEINDLQEGMVVNVNYQSVKGKFRRIMSIESVVH